LGQLVSPWLLCSRASKSNNVLKSKKVISAKVPSMSRYSGMKLNKIHN